MIKLSYIISTHNRLSLLKIIFPKLLTELKDDEEIVVVDGNSSDGSKEYLQNLLDEGKIHQFISEPDKNQAHGWNKALLLANGTVIKKIIDDDVFDYNSIRKCAAHMIAHPKIDVLISNDLSASIYNLQSVTKNSRLTHFEEWAKGKKPSFTFGDVNMLIKKSALSYIGLYHTGYVMMDWEYALRISFLKANICYYTGYNALSVAHEDTITSNQVVEQIVEQSKKAHVFYSYKGDASEISLWSKFKIYIGKKLFTHKAINTHSQKLSTMEREAAYKHFSDYLAKLNAKEDYHFIHSDSIEKERN